MANLKEQKRILKENIKKQEKMIKNNESYTGPDGKTYGPDHYKKAVKYDREELQRVKNKLQKQEKINSIKKAANKVDTSNKTGNRITKWDVNNEGGAPVAPGRINTNRFYETGGKEGNINGPNQKPTKKKK